MPLKITMIGAGSIGFTRDIVQDILCVPEFRDTEFAFVDINERNLDMVYKLCKRDIESAGLPAKLSATTDRREAVTGSDYVFSWVRVGGLEGFETDIDIPLRYGVDQCVGDTLGPGGIMYAQRTIPVLLEFCKDISEVAARDCLFLNHANPMAMNMWGVNMRGRGVRNVGLCHGVQHTSGQLAGVLGIPREEMSFIAAGINHQTWFISIKHKGRELTGEVLEAFERHPEVVEKEKVRVDVLRRFGYYSTESNGHLSEYLPWYRKRLDDLPNWADLSYWAGGETGGYLRVCREGRNWFETEFPRWMEEPPRTFDPEDRGSEHGSYILEGLETGRAYRGHFNVVNHGTISNLPEDAIVEVPGYVDATGINIPRVGELPPGCAAVCNDSINAQRLAVQAAVTGDDVLLRQAMMMDPLTGAVCSPPEIRQMVDEMLLAQEALLPQYKQAIADAKRRLAAGPKIPHRDYKGLRVKEKSVEEMRASRGG